jgi:hypothetical protein
MLLSVLLRHALYLGWVLSLRNVRSCGCLRMICGTRPLGHRPQRNSQDGVPQEQETAPLSLPQLDHLYEASFARDETSVSNTGVAAIPSQFKVTQQVLLKWQPFRDLKLKFVGSRRQEQLSSYCLQDVVATVEESVVRTEMTGLESQEEDAPKCVLFYKPMSCLGQIRPVDATSLR